MKTVLAVDGGNSKTDVVIATEFGDLLARVRGPGSSPDALGIPGSLAVLTPLVDQAREQAGIDNAEPDAAAFLLAGVDQPGQEVDLAAALTPRRFACDLVVSNDTFAVLLAGAPHGWGVAVVCGAGINAIGVAEDGRIGRYQALGELSGDWGGGHAVGLAALGAAIRGEDGRGPATALTEVLSRALAVDRPQEIAAAIHEGRLGQATLVEMSPLVFACADSGDAAAATIVARVGDEVATMAIALLRNLGMDRGAVDVVLGGGLLQAGHTRLINQISGQILAAAPSAELQILDVPPVVGSVRAGLQRLHLPLSQIDGAIRRVSDRLAAS